MTVIAILGPRMADEAVDPDIAFLMNHLCQKHTSSSSIKYYFMNVLWNRMHSPTESICYGATVRVIVLAPAAQPQVCIG
jgi:hypothetical protein